MDDNTIIEDEEVISVIEESQQAIKQAQEKQSQALRIYCSLNDIDMDRIQDFKMTPNGDIALIIEEDE